MHCALCRASAGARLEEEELGVYNSFVCSVRTACGSSGLGVPAEQACPVKCPGQPPPVRSPCFPVVINQRAH